jgi:hypothetical protein
MTEGAECGFDEMNNILNVVGGDFDLSLLISHT